MVLHVYYFLNNDYSIRWRDESQKLFQDIFASAETYMKEVFKMTIEDRYASKVAEALFSLLVDAYIERFVLAGNSRFKLHLNFDKVLLDFVYNDSQLSKKDKDKII